MIGRGEEGGRGKRVSGTGVPTKELSKTCVYVSTCRTVEG
jgi:hypothetical protein